jgi:hypothetical protein
MRRPYDATCCRRREPRLSASNVIPFVGLMRERIPRMQPWNGVVRQGYYFGRGRSGFGGWSKSKAYLDQKTGPMRGWTLHDARRTVATRMADYNHAKRLAEVKGALEAWAAEMARDRPSLGPAFLARPPLRGWRVEGLRWCYRSY